MKATATLLLALCASGCLLVKDRQVSADCIGQRCQMARQRTETYIADLTGMPKPTVPAFATITEDYITDTMDNVDEIDAWATAQVDDFGVTQNGVVVGSLQERRARAAYKVKAKIKSEAIRWAKAKIGLPTAPAPTQSSGGPWAEVLGGVATLATAGAGFAGLKYRRERGRSRQLRDGARNFARALQSLKRDGDASSVVDAVEHQDATDVEAGKVVFRDLKVRGEV